MRAPELDFLPTMPVLLRRAVEQHGDADFVVSLDRRCSFREAEEITRVLAKRMLAAGVGKGTKIGIAFPSSADWMLAWIAAARIGAVSMLFSSTYRPRELRDAMRIGDVSLLLAPRILLGKDYEAHLEVAVPGLAERGRGPLYLPALPYLRAIWVVGGSERAWVTPVAFDAGNIGSGDDTGISDELLVAVESEVAPADPIVVVYTSGSAAEPKAVVHTHGTVVRKTSTGSNLGLQGSYPGHRVLCAMPFFWVGGVQMLAGALHSGSAIVCQERFDAAGALDLIERERVTTMLGWATTLAAINEGATEGARDLSSLGSVPLPQSTVGNRLGISSKGDPPNMGMTETLGPHYRPDHFDYKIIDPDTGATLPEGVEGEFCVRGYGLMAGMYKREREEVFDEEGWYHTGDRSYLEEGRVFFTGRFTEMIKSGGANVAPLEVETVLQSFPEVQLAFVFGMPHTERGEEVTAVLVPEDGAALDVRELRERARAELSSYKVPTRFHTLSRDDVPWLPSGKPDKITLKQQLDHNEPASTNGVERRLLTQVGIGMRRHDMTGSLPSYDELPVREGAPPGSSWGVWGDHDVFGTLNLLTPDRVLAAARSIRTGRVFSLNPELTLPDPPLFNRARMRHEVTGELGGGHDDLYHNWNTQASAQWDGFRHFAHREHGHYGGVPDEEHGIHYWAERGIVGRAVLADVARWRAQQGRPIRAGESDPITADDLAACLADQQATVETGDILLIRTGWMSWYRGLDDDARAGYASERMAPSVGLSGLDVPRMLWDLHVAAVAADNPAVEMIPMGSGTFLHVHFLPLLGIPLGELWDLDELADDCAEAGTYDCFFTSAPLNMPNGVASPPNAIAVR